MTAKPGQIALRKFDHDEARRRYAAGEKIGPLAREYGVVWAAVARVVDPRVGARMDRQRSASLERARMPCRGGCGVLVWTHGRGKTGLCPTCLGDSRRVVAHGTEGEYTVWGCRCPRCTEAANAARRARRHRSWVPCSHGCGTMVDAYNGRRPGKPPECRPCAMKRVWEEHRQNP